MCPVPRVRHRRPRPSRPLPYERVWSVTLPTRPVGWYSHHRLLADQVVIEWISLDRKTGAVRWSTDPGPPNTIAAIDERKRMIVAGEMRSDGPWTLTFGCYGVDLDSGALRWTAESDRKRRGLLRLLDFIPGVASPSAGTAQTIVDGCVITSEGDLLDVVTGRPMERPPASARAWWDRKKDDDALWGDSSDDRSRAASEELYRRGSVRMLDGARLFARALLGLESEYAEPAWTTDEGLEFACVESNGQIRWRWASSAVETNYYGWRYLPGLLLLMRSDGGGRWTLVVLDPLTGRIEQEFTLGGTADAARIEDAAGDGVVLSLGEMKVTLLRWRDDGLPR